MFHRFKGGIHPDPKKDVTANQPIESMPLPKRLVIPVRQHIGAPATPLVKKGDQLKTGQLIAQSSSQLSSNIHSSTSGIVVDVDQYPHPVFGKSLAIVLESDGLDTWNPLSDANANWETLSKEQLLEIVREAGIVGMGGAAFPTNVKLNPPPDKKIDTLILNGAECEPYLTADHRMMLESADEVISGMRIVMHILGVQKAYIGIENNKPDALKHMKKETQGTPMTVVGLPAKYPQGAEKMLIKGVTNQEVPPGALPMDVGVVVQNVGTVVSIHRAVYHGIPLIERVVTVSGSAVKAPKNVRVRVGTSFSEVIAYCGGFVTEPEKVIMGGPMMGISQASLDVPVLKGVSGILCFNKADIHHGKESPCIRCGRCIQACPMNLNPSMLSLLGEKGLYEEARNAYHLLDCFECGNCTYSCPSKRNILQYIRYLKQRNAGSRQKIRA